MSRRGGWDDRRGSDHHQQHRHERKRRFEEDSRPRDDNQQKYRRDDDRHHHQQQQHQQREYRSSDRPRSREHDDLDGGGGGSRPRKTYDWEKKGRYDQSFVKKEEASPEWGKVKTEPKVKTEKEKPNFQASGKLTEEANMVHGVIIKYSEPSDARKPKRRWRLYPFKGEKSMPVLYIHRQSAYLMGRDRKIADIPVDHPSCSKQHAALQYRLVSYKRPDGSEGKHIRPYLIDLDSANGTFVNNVKLEPKRYHELLERDVIKFGFSSREYVVLHEQSKDEAQDDDVEET